MPTHSLEIFVRDECAADAAAIRSVHTAAFAGTQEARLVDALRDARAVVVSQVAVVLDEVVGHVLFSPVSVEYGDASTWLGLAPLGVQPAHQRRGAGTALLRSSVQRARALGAGAVVLVGEPEYYRRFGFKAARQFGLRCKWPGTEAAFMVLALAPGTLAVCSGLVRYHEEFDALE